LPVNPNYKKGVNVAEQRENPESVLHYLRRLINVRQTQEALRHGEISLLETDDVLAFWRQTGQQRCIVALNMSTQVTMLHLEKQAVRELFSTHTRDKQGDLSSLALQPFEVYIGIAE
jgi:glycosidase